METCLKNYKEATKVIYKTWGAGLGAGNFLTYDALIFQLLFHFKHKVAVSKTTRPPPSPSPLFFFNFFLLFQFLETSLGISHW